MYLHDEPALLKDGRRMHKARWRRKGRAEHTHQPIDALHVVVGLVSAHGHKRAIGEDVGPLLEGLQLRPALLG